MVFGQILKQNNLEISSWTDFKTTLQKEGYFTTFFQLELTTEELEIWNNLCEHTLEAPSLSPPRTTTTSTSYTTALSIPVPADVDVLKIGEDLERSLVEFFGAVTSHNNTGQISSTISIMMDDELTTWKSEAESGSEVIKLEVYPFSKIQHLEKKDLWKYASWRSTTVIRSNSNPIRRTYQQLQHAIIQVSKAKKGSYERKGPHHGDFSFSYKNT